MLRLRLAAALALGLAATAATAQPPAGQNLALPFPAKAPIVVAVNGVEKVKGRLTKMLEALPPAESGKVKQGIEEGLTKMLEGRSLKGVVPDGRLFLVVHDVTTLGDEEPGMAVLVPVTSYDEFKKTALTGGERGSVEKAGDGVESFTAGEGGKTLYLAQVKGYAVLSPSKETAASYAGKYTPAQSGAMGTELSASFLAADVALYVNMDVINELYGDKIQQFKQLIDFALGMAQQGGMLPGLNKQQVEMVKVVMQGALQGVEDGKGLVLAAEFRPDGLNARVQARFGEETDSAAFLKAEASGPLADLGKLPKGLSSYAGSKFGKRVTDLMRKFGGSFAAADDDDGGAGRIDKLMAEVAAAGPGAEYAATAGADAGVTVTGYKAPAKAAAALAKLYEGLGAGAKANTIVLKEKPKVTYDAQTHRGFTFAEVGVVYDFDATVEALPENVRETTLNSLKRMAKEKTTLWIGTDGKAVATLTGKDWAAAKKLLDEYLDGNAAVGAEAGFKLTRKNLPADATAVYLVETAQTLEALTEQAKAAAAAMPGGGGPLGNLGKLGKGEGELTYVGFALTLKGQVAAVDLFVPGPAMNVASKMLAPLFRNVE